MLVHKNVNMYFEACVLDIFLSVMMTETDENSVSFNCLSNLFCSAKCSLKWPM